MTLLQKTPFFPFSVPPSPPTLPPLHIIWDPLYLEIRCPVSTVMAATALDISPANWQLCKSMQLWDVIGKNLNQEGVLHNGTATLFLQTWAFRWPIYS